MIPLIFEDIISLHDFIQRKSVGYHTSGINPSFGDQGQNVITGIGIHASRFKGQVFTVHIGQRKHLGLFIQCHYAYDTVWPRRLPGQLKSIHPACRYFESERNFYRCALAIKGQNSFQDYFLEIIRPLIPIFLSDSLKTSEDQQFLLNFFYDGLISSLIRWLSEENETTAEEFTGHLKSVLLLFAEEIFNNLKDTPSAPQPD